MCLFLLKKKELFDFKHRWFGDHPCCSLVPVSYTHLDVYKRQLFVWLSLSLWAARQPEFSTAGFFRLDNSGREVYSMNPAWRFHKGAVEGAETKEFNDKDWTVVSLPDGIEYLPTEASGCINYQGEVWYRKHFTPCLLYTSRCV